MAGEGNRHVLAVRIGLGRQGTAEPLRDVPLQLGEREGPAFEFQPLQDVVDGRLVDLDAGEAVGRGLRPGRVAAQLVVARQPHAHHEALLGGLAGHQRGLQCQGVNGPSTSCCNRWAACLS